MCLLCLNCYSQFDFKNSLEFNTSYGISGDYGDIQSYMTFAPLETINLSNKSAARTRNFELSYTRFFTSKNGVKASLGLARYGFDYSGISDISSEVVNGIYRLQYLELGLSYCRRIPISKTTQVLVEPGFRYHLNGEFTASSIFVFFNESYSFSLYSGYEMPLIGDNYFVNVGLQL